MGTQNDDKSLITVFHKDTRKGFNNELYGFVFNQTNSTYRTFHLNEKDWCRVSKLNPAYILPMDNFKLPGIVDFECPDMKQCQDMLDQFIRAGFKEDKTIPLNFGTVTIKPEYEKENTNDFFIVTAQGMTENGLGEIDFYLVSASSEEKCEGVAETEFCQKYEEYQCSVQRKIPKEAVLIANRLCETNRSNMSWISSFLQSGDDILQIPSYRLDDLDELRAIAESLSEQSYEEVLEDLDA